MARDLPTLSARETEVVRALSEGRSQKQVAADLGVATRTVNAHVYNAAAKLNAGNAPELVRRAIELGYIPIDVQAARREFLRRHVQRRLGARREETIAVMVDALMAEFEESVQ